MAGSSPATGCLLGLVLLLAGCAGGGGWIKPGADETAAASDYRECREAAGAAVKTEADIDQDIAATRSGDLQRAGVFRQQTETARTMTRDRASAIVAACMRGKGYGPAR